MELQKFEGVLAVLERGAADVSALGALRADLVALQQSLEAKVQGEVTALGALRADLIVLQQSLTANVQSVADLRTSMGNTLTRTEELNTALLSSRDDIRAEVRTQADKFEKTVETQLARATTQYETFVSHRIDLNTREIKQTVSDALERMTDKLQKQQQMVLVVLVVAMLLNAGLLGALLFGLRF